MPYDITKRINRCRHCFMEHKKPYRKQCLKDAETKQDAKFITESDCDSCPHYDSRYIEYPITVKGIDYEPRNNYNLDKPGLVKIRPCAEKYENKTYLGLLLGDLPLSAHVTFDNKTQKLTVGMHNNPAIFIFETKEVVYGCESWWSKIDDESELKDITDETINSQWYVAALKHMSEKTEETPDKQ